MSLYVVKINQEYIPIAEDIIRMVLIQITIQLLLSFGGESQFFTSYFILSVIYIVLGICLYWLVFKKLITFSSD